MVRMMSRIGLSSCSASSRSARLTSSPPRCNAKSMQEGSKVRVIGCIGWNCCSARFTLLLPASKLCGQKLLREGCSSKLHTSKQPCQQKLSLVRLTFAFCTELKPQGSGGSVESLALFFRSQLLHQANPLPCESL
eukprot:1142896-Pelagomonas_calceolata.AAC.2